VTGQKTKPNIHSAFFQRCLDFRGRDFFNRYADRRLIGGKRAKELRHEGHIQRRDHTQTQ